MGDAVEFPGQRSFAAIHRDVWRCVRRAPTVFLCLPAIAYFLLSWAVEAYARSQSLETGQQLRTSLQVWFVLTPIVIPLLTSVQLSALVEIRGGRRPTITSSLRGGFDLWASVGVVYVLAAIRIGLGFLLFVLPGFYLLWRYAFALPAVALSGAVRSEALGASATAMRGQYRRVLGGVACASLLYFPFAFAPALFAPYSLGSAFFALAEVPSNVLSSLIAIGLTLLYVDRSGETAAAPLGAAVCAEADTESWSQAGRSGVLRVGLASLSTVLATAWLFHLTHIAPIDAGDAAWERGETTVARRHYERAAFWDPDDAYLHFSIGWCDYVLEDFEAAERSFARSIALDRGEGDFFFGHAQALIALGRKDAARRALAEARRLGYPEDEVDESLEEMEPPWGKSFRSARSAITMFPAVARRGSRSARGVRVGSGSGSAGPSTERLMLIPVG